MDLKSDESSLKAPELSGVYHEAFILWEYTDDNDLGEYKYT